MNMSEGEVLQALDECLYRAQVDASRDPASEGTYLRQFVDDATWFLKQWKGDKMEFRRG